MFTSVGSVEKALSGAGSGVFFMGYNLFRGISVELVEGLMASPVVVGEKNLFAGEKGVAYLGI